MKEGYSLPCIIQFKEILPLATKNFKFHSMKDIHTNQFCEIHKIVSLFSASDLHGSRSEHRNESAENIKRERRN